jgi:RHS repeat-associated protein
MIVPTTIAVAWLNPSAGRSCAVPSMADSSVFRCVTKRRICPAAPRRAAGIALILLYSDRENGWVARSTAPRPIATRLRSSSMRRRDQETGLDYMMARYYSSALGRFMSSDYAPEPLSRPSAWNRFTYTKSNPRNRIDPDGLAWMAVTQPVGKSIRADAEWRAPRKLVQLKLDGVG